MSTTFVDRIEIQHRLFAELSRMFGREVPLYDKSLLVNTVCNTAVCELLAERHRGFTITAKQLEKTSGERHGAIRIGTPEEYRWVTRFFGAFAMEPHNYYDMSDVGAKSQPIVATAFRSRVNPEHRVFCSLLMTDYFDPETRARIEALLATRHVFTERAKALIEKGEQQGGLEAADAEALIREGVERIFRWTGTARDHALYTHLCQAGFKIAADIACFESHHLNHLTPNTLCMDLYVAAMKRCLGELDDSTFARRAERALERLLAGADGDWMRLHFRNLTPEEIAGFTAESVSTERVSGRVVQLVKRLGEADLRLHELHHSGSKDVTEGPPAGVPVLLRQDAYKALTEPVIFRNPDGATVHASHTARFGEIEQRFYATTPAGRELYDRCLAESEAMKEQDPSLVTRDFEAFEAMAARPFEVFPRTLAELLRRGLVHGLYSATAEGIAVAARGSIQTTDLDDLFEKGLVRVEGLRYEDFLPVSAAGIFASNLSQYGTKSTAAVKPTYTQAMLEAVMGRTIIDAGAAYAAMEADSIAQTCAVLGRAGQGRLSDALADARNVSTFSKP